MKINKKIKKIKVTENDFKDFKKSMVLYITTWQEVLDDNQEDTMNTKPEWFIEFESKRVQCWKERKNLINTNS